MLKGLHIFILGTIIRLVLLLYGEWQDHNLEVKYTDIDYYVYSDASSYILQGKSPFLRHTYRYTPLLAYLLLPNSWLFCFGKIIFILADLWTGLIILKILKHHNYSESYTAIWLLNPLVFNISTRGSSDSISSLLILSTVWLLENHKLTSAGICYGLAVHFRIYPIIYALALYLYIDHDKKSFFTYKRLKFTIISAGVFLILGTVFYWVYGFEFLYETYLYHFVRKDNRHNFSVYFYPLYLTYTTYAKWVGLMAFIPQWGLIIYMSFSRLPLYITMLSSTFVFVIFNKVCTAQYFIWYITLLPITLPGLKISLKSGLGLIIPWVLTEVHWLYWGYRLEFLGENVFWELWAASLCFFVANARVLVKLMQGVVGEKQKNA
ncbi:hypothetical protein SteCoe_1195 [Stentor coeruleus]|uniref:GPI mannosyltransferase 1 n=1 Tax=Stentor coeruleus TaxID=5963 RepID=A0A1R2D2J5_9CILI|nr:hypothetical protein SteCoe_1195 [Stentor coeruleus]